MFTPVLKMNFVYVVYVLQPKKMRVDEREYLSTDTDEQNRHTVRCFAEILQAYQASLWFFNYRVPTVADFIGNNQYCPEFSPIHEDWGVVVIRQAHM